MHVKRMLAPAVIATVLATFAFSAQAGKARPAPGPAPECVRYEYAFTPAADGQSVHVDATIKNGCFPGVDMDGIVSLTLAGQVLAQAPLGPLDTATLSVDIPLAAVQGQELCLGLKGSRAEMIRRKLEVSALDAKDCRTLRF